MLKKTAILSCFLLLSNNVFAQETPQTALDQGNIQQANALLEAQTVSTDDESAIQALCGQAQIAMQTGNLQAVPPILQALESRKENLKSTNGWHMVIAWTQAEYARLTGDTDAQKLHLNNALLAYSNGKNINMAWGGFILFELAQITSNNSDARDFTEMAINAFKQHKQVEEEGVATAHHAKLEWERGKQRRAFNDYDDAIRLFRKAKALKRVAQTQLIVVERQLEADNASSAAARLKAAANDVQAANDPELQAKWNALNEKFH